MKSYQEILEHHLRTGYFSQEIGSKYHYVLSPKPFFCNSSMKKQIDEIGIAVASYLKGSECFLKDKDHCTNNMISSLRGSIISQTGFPVYEGNYRVPLCKVDVMIDTSNRLKIAEIDAYNPRGIAFAAFIKDAYKGYTDHSFFSGAEKTLAEEVLKKEYSKLVWLYAHHERFYEVVFEQLKRIMFEKYSIEIIPYDTDMFLVSKHMDETMFTMIPWGMRTLKEVMVAQPTLVFLYEQNPERFLYSPTPFLGNKALMGFVSNGGLNVEMEEFLMKYYGEKNLSLLRKYIPETVLIGRRFRKDLEIFLKSRQASVLKANISSGLKGVWVYDSIDDLNMNSKIQSFMQEKKPNYTLQEYIEQKKFLLESYSGKNNTLKEDDWYLRMTLQVDSNGVVVDAEITGRKTPDVHGAVDCIQIPCVF